MIVWIALAGSIGAVIRFMLDGFIKTKTSPQFPWATLCINITGSFLLGVITAFMASFSSFHAIGLVLGTGFMGGYTTFSTASFETVRLIERRRYGTACLYAFGGAGAAVMAALLGYSCIG